MLFISTCWGEALRPKKITCWGEGLHGHFILWDLESWASKYKRAGNTTNFSFCSAKP